MSITIHGIRNCTTMQKARAWLEAHAIAHDFHDYRSAGITREKLASWAGQVGWEALLNRSGQTFRKLPEAEKQGLDAPKAMALMLAQPAMIRRPVLELPDGRLLVGFRPEAYAAALGSKA